MTDKEKVLAKWPDAYISGSYSFSQAPDEFDVVIRSTQKTVGSGHTPEKAWASAARRLNGAEGETYE